MTSIFTIRPNRAALLAGVLSAAVAGFTGPAAAQSSGEQTAPSTQAPAAMQELQAKRQKIQELSSELRTLQQKVTQADPELKAEQEKFRELVFDNMQGENFDPQAEIERMRGLRSELQGGGGDMAQEDRQAKMQELQEKQEQFRSKQREAMQTEEVQTARQELNERMKSAMTEENPEVEQMLAELSKLQQEYRSLLQEVMKQQQGGGQG